MGKVAFIAANGKYFSGVTDKILISTDLALVVLYKVKHKKK